MKTLISVIILVVSLTSGAQAIEYWGPQCRRKNVFPFVTCESKCFSYYPNFGSGCSQKAQFGCEYKKCSSSSYRCALNPAVEKDNPCPNGEVPVKSINLTSFVDFNLAINLRGYSTDVVLLIDTSSSTRPHLKAIKNELSSFVRQLNGSAKVGVAVYGSEESYDESGLSVLSAVTDYVDPALEALESIPETVDGTRTTITALKTLSSSVAGLNLRGNKRIIVLIGDRPGREPDCRNGYNRDMVLPSSTMISVSLGSDGLNSALPAPSACMNGSYYDPSPIAVGQARDIVNRTNGEVVEIVTAASLLWAVDTVRRRPVYWYNRPPGSNIRVSSASFPLYRGPYTPPVQRYSNGCGNKVYLRTSGLPAFISAPAEVTASVHVALPKGVCIHGPFTCEIRVVEIRRGGEYPSSWSIPFEHFEVIKIHGCQGI
ncbi:hypothetical protein BWQ96_07021 [Gracilariopsis chorda]|uniref:VWFA domain-containing protein n=1 Tax=Gracilariopsis chorda TaxID=448386 RepID=A0A2V3IME3_9FLOR|nr:hypothetical protein BWQ96_07021 [Gracilariopsis chorda]|eukprot:PXF43248.1 hypothetical protein BWQ96_07021 [Gracilariopsis chorda]